MDVTFSAGRLNEVRSAIDRAFSRHPMPDPTALTGGRLAARWPQSADDARIALGGRPWTDLDRHFWSQGGYLHLTYLSAAGYRYYLPGLLRSALDEPIDGGFVYSAAFHLRPEWTELCERGQVDDEQRALFDEENRSAVAAWLELLFDEWLHRRDLSADALYWVWNRTDTPGLRKARQYYEERTHFQRVSYPADPRARAVALAIASAFSDVPYPGDNLICNLGGGEEPYEYAVRYRGHDWRALDPRLLDFEGGALSFFTDEAFRYYLPAFLIADLAGEFMLANANPTFHLWYGLADYNGDDDAWVRYPHLRQAAFDRAVRRFSAFTAVERAAVADYLEFPDRGDPKEVGQALARFWRPVDAVSARSTS
ncbi:MAG: hypothetical protein IV100_02730 [Myxococcales bacterium]|nr:hypothetical protein [Myxococcales bacterium]